ncbi:MAG: HAMP domain-containing protein, partial [Candidatus Kapabacteria bacterium]|nr:HAMP domain-containing protein [Candidatus Kapabacteria bacterium]
VGYPLTEIQDTLNELFGVFLFGLPVALFISILGGYLLARYSLRPVDVLTHTAHEITAHNLGMRLPAPPVNDEIGRLTDTLNEMIARLESSFAQIRQFTSDASHELRTPLAILMGELELILRRPRTPDDYQQAISSALEEVVRLSKVVESLLDISRAETGQVHLQLDLMNISKLTEDVCEDLEIIAAEKQIAMKYEIQPFATIVGDQARLHQVLLNVIDNAIKYTREGGSVGVKLWVENTQTLISVSDTGIGIPADDIPHIFDRFYRVDKSRTRYDVPGTGLGLSIVKWIVEAHKGTITAASTENKGTVITITLPADPHAVAE